jgi:methionyl-tRNA formyltransferase
MKIILFVNDNYFSCLLAKLLVLKYHKSVQLAIFSNKTTGSLFQILKICKKTYFEYFAYRSTVQIISILNGVRGRKTLRSLLKQYKIPCITLTNVHKNVEVLNKLGSLDIGIALNFDQILSSKILKLFNFGVINVHASKLPKDRGVSPAMWAFARGDQEIWSSIYKMDPGIDTGPIYKQFAIPVEPKNTFFSLYERVCEESGKQLLLTIEEIEKGVIVPKPQRKDLEENYLGFPNKEHKDLMRLNNRRFINVDDIIGLLK